MDSRNPSSDDSRRRKGWLQLPRKKAVVLFSGGLDSAVTLALAIEAGRDPYPLCFDYGQSNRVEIARAQRLVREHFKLPRDLNVCKIDYGAVAPQCLMLGGSGNWEEPSDISVPNRFMVFMGLAAAYAQSLGAQEIWIGNQIEPGPIKKFDSDSQDGFYSILGDTIQYLSRHVDVGASDLRVISPILDEGKAAILDIAKEFGIELDAVRTCLSSKNTPCGACVSCNAMRKATGLVC